MLINAKSNKPWITDPTVDPSEDTYCECGEGFTRDPLQPTRCIPNTCHASGGDMTERQGKRACDCPPPVQGDNGDWKSSISCPSDYTTNYPPCSSIHPRCVEDPCNPGGYFDPSSGKCKCSGTFVEHGDSSSPIGSRCVDVCGSLNNPCGGRGKCQAIGDGL